MVIEEQDFRLTYITGCLWDLELLQTIKPKSKPERQEFQIEGYGIPMENCIQRIIHYRLNEKQETYSLKEFLDNYKLELNKLSNLLNYGKESN